MIAAAILAGYHDYPGQSSGHGGKEAWVVPSPCILEGTLGRRCR